MTEAEAKELFKAAGYRNVYDWFDSPEDVYPPHAHPTDRDHMIIQGELSLSMDNQTRTYRPGERFMIPAKMVHTAIMGPDGCHYVVGEK